MCYTIASFCNRYQGKLVLTGPSTASYNGGRGRINMEFDTERLKREIQRLRADQEDLLKRIEKLEAEVEGREPGKTKRVNPLEELRSKGEPRISMPKIAKPKVDLEFRIGSTWLNRIGVVAVIFGLAFFLKYSFDNQWIGPTGRVLLGVLAGLLMMGAGEKLRHRYAGYAQGLLGGGSLALFFSIYASYQFYQLIPAVYAFLFLILVMAATVFMAIRHHSLPIGILGIVGGYLTPFLIGSDEPSLWTLFSYLALLTAGVLAVSIFQKWPVFQYLSFLFNQVIFLLTWLASAWSGTGEEFLPKYLFLIYNFLLYLGVATVYNIRQQKKATTWDIGLILLNAFAFFGLSLLLLEDTFMEDYLGFYALFIALVYIYLGKMAYRLYSEDQAQVYSLFLVSFVLITIAIPLQLTEAYIAMAWLAEAVGLAYMAKQLNIPKVYYSSWLVLFLGLALTWKELERLLWMDEETFFLNHATLLWLTSLLALLLMIKLDSGFRLFDTKIKTAHVLKVLFLLLVWLGLTIENSHFFQLQDTEFFLSPEQLSLSAIWLLYAVILFIVGIRRKNRYFRYAALGLVAIVIVKAFLVDLANLDTVFKILLFIILGLFLLGISYFYEKKKDAIQAEEEIR